MLAMHSSANNNQTFTSASLFQIAPTIQPRTPSLERIDSSAMSSPETPQKLETPHVKQNHSMKGGRETDMSAEDLQKAVLGLGYGELDIGMNDAEQISLRGGSLVHTAVEGSLAESSSTVLSKQKLSLPNFADDEIGFRASVDLAGVNQRLSALDECNRQGDGWKQRDELAGMVCC